MKDKGQHDDVCAGQIIMYESIHSTTGNAAAGLSRGPTLQQALLMRFCFAYSAWGSGEAPAGLVNPPASTLCIAAHRSWLWNSPGIVERLLSWVGFLVRVFGGAGGARPRKSEQWSAF